MWLLIREKKADVWTPNPDSEQSMVVSVTEVKTEYGSTKEDVIDSRGTWCHVECSEKSWVSAGGCGRGIPD